MRVVIRVDAASHIGAGNVMRCLTLANELKEKGAEVSALFADLFLGLWGGALLPMGICYNSCLRQQLGL